MSEVKMLCVSVFNRVARYATSCGSIVCDNDGYLVNFALGPEWAGLKAKARFVWNGKHEDVPIEDGVCPVPVINRAKEVWVGVISDDGSLCTTTAARIPCEFSVKSRDTVPTEGNEAYYASEAEKAAKRAEEAAERAEQGVVTDEQMAAAVQKYLEEHPLIPDTTETRPKIAMISLPASGWVGTDGLYSQIVAVEGATENSQVDLTPSIEQLAIFHEKDLAFVTENEDGVVTVYALGDRPQNDYTMQVTITEVNV